MPNPAYAPLRKTKMSIPPLRDGCIPRTQLFEQLTRESNRPLTLVSAPAGFGKTTALAGWLRTSEQRSRVAWLSLDDEDNDPVRLFYYIVATLQKVEPEIGRALTSLFGFLQTP
ncbi:MAG TPA: LuxR family transcriptional regulator, partial [Burkholderiaceae bacterium]|nr:LuxR family transcriptional regulator [Burkholderiaceae bacterium]